NRPAHASTRHGTAGRRNTSIQGKADSRNRRVANRKAGNSASPHLMTTKFVPQMKTAASANNEWDSGMYQDMGRGKAASYPARRRPALPPPTPRTGFRPRRAPPDEKPVRPRRWSRAVRGTAAPGRSAHKGRPAQTLRPPVAIRPGTTARPGRPDRPARRPAPVHPARRPRAQAPGGRRGTPPDVADNRAPSHRTSDNA